MIEKVTRLSEKGGKLSYECLAIFVPEMGMKMPTPRVMSKKKTQKNLEMVWECLMDDEVRKIGVYGMGGIGKTTILKEINNRLLREQERFDKIIWITVSRDANVRKLQDDISKELDLDLSGVDNEVRRSALLLRALEKRKRVVLILDDMWEAFPLHEVGIPEPTKHSGCKLALSTRSSEVCKKMECQMSIEVELLSKEEAWELFMDKIAELLAPEITEIAKILIEECAGLPLAIVATGGAMTGKDDIQEWRVALSDLRDSTNWIMDMEDNVFKCLKFSYDQLGNELLKQCFLLCALYPEDWNIREEDLIDYWIMEAVVEGSNRQVELDRGRTILNKLIRSCMLEKSKFQYSYYDQPHACVKMHDLLRDMALCIARTTKKFMIKSGLRLEELPDVHEWDENLERVSLMHNRIEGVSISPKCPRLSTLLLQGNPFRNIANHFFTHMQNLRFLNLSETDIEVLPNSISNLVNLHVLLLYNCHRLETIPSLAKLQSLKILDLSDTGIIELPQGMEALVNLKRLDLQHTKLREIAAGLISKLPLLQELQLYCVDDVHISGGEIGTNFVDELLSLTHLENLSISFCYLAEFTRYVGSVKFEGLNNFFFDVENVNKVFRPFKKRGVFMCNYSCCMPSHALLLPQNTKFLYVSMLDDLTRLPKMVCLNNVRDLRECHIGYCSSMEYILSTEDEKEEQSTLLQHLEEMRIHDCPKLLTLYKGVATHSTLSSLNELFIWKCPYLKYLFSSNLFKQLRSLEGVCVQHCDGLEELISSEETDEESSTSTVNNAIIVSRLKKFDLFSLPKLKMLFPRLLLHFQNLQELYVSDCEQIEEPVAVEEREDVSKSSSSYTAVITVPTLQKIHFRDLKLKSIWSGISICNSLRYISVWGCHELKTLLSTRLMQHFQTLEEIYVYDCRQMEEILLVEEEMDEGTINTTTTSAIHTIILPRLLKLKLYLLPNLKNIWKGVMICESLQLVEVFDCGELKRLPQFSGEYQSPPPDLKGIRGSEEWWDSLEWDSPYAKNLLHPISECEFPITEEGKKIKKKKTSSTSWLLHDSQNSNISLSGR